MKTIKSIVFLEKVNDATTERDRWNPANAQDAAVDPAWKVAQLREQEPACKELDALVTVDDNAGFEIHDQNWVIARAWSP